MLLSSGVGISSLCSRALRLSGRNMMDASESMGNILRLKASVRDFDRVNFDEEERRKVKTQKM